MRLSTFITITCVALVQGRNLNLMPNAHQYPASGSLPSSTVQLASNPMSTNNSTNSKRSTTVVEEIDIIQGQPMADTNQEAYVSVVYPSGQTGYSSQNADNVVTWSEVVSPAESEQYATGVQGCCQPVYTGIDVEPAVQEPSAIQIIPAPQLVPAPSPSLVVVPEPSPPQTVQVIPVVPATPEPPRPIQYVYYQVRPVPQRPAQVIPAPPQQQQVQVIPVAPAPPPAQVVPVPPSSSAQVAPLPTGPIVQQPSPLYRPFSYLKDKLRNKFNYLFNKKPYYGSY